jgi:hypothetical protein
MTYHVTTTFATTSFQTSHSQQDSELKDQLLRIGRDDCTISGPDHGNVAGPARESGIIENIDSIRNGREPLLDPAQRSLRRRLRLEESWRRITYAGPLPVSATIFHSYGQRRSTQTKAEALSMEIACNGGYDLPRDCWQGVLEHLDPPELARAACINTTCALVCKDDDRKYYRPFKKWSPEFCVSPSALAVGVPTCQQPDMFLWDLLWLKIHTQTCTWRVNSITIVATVD